MKPETSILILGLCLTGVCVIIYGVCTELIRHESRIHTLETKLKAKESK